MSDLIKVAVILAFIAVGSGNLPKILNLVRKAQIQLVTDSQASKWPRAMVLKSK
jgi:Na+-translocating ferredoxin:NAD+ oxidoreductase RnfG subunit